MTLPLAFAIGFSVASIPGPTIILITTETLRKGAKAGLVTMAAPILMDGLLMLPLGLLLQASLFYGKGALFLGLVGAAFLCWMGLQSIRAGTNEFRVAGYRFRELDPSMNSGSTLSKAARVETRNSKLETPTIKNQEMPSFLKGVLTHITSPYPYLYWGTVGASFIRQGYESGGLWNAALFPAGFWLGASTFTLLAIYVIARGQKMLPGAIEPHLHRFSGVLLIASGIFLAIKVWQGAF